MKNERELLIRLIVRELRRVDLLTLQCVLAFLRG